MSRLEWMYLKACVPAAVVAVGAFLIALRLKGLQDSPIFAGVVDFAPWVVLVGFAAAVLLLVAPTWRLLR